MIGNNYKGSIGVANGKQQLQRVLYVLQMVGSNFKRSIGDVDVSQQLKRVYYRK
jgi:hypothetical protein